MAKNERHNEFLVVMAASSGTIAIAIDAMLPAFSELRQYFGLAETSSSAALIITVFMAGLGVGQFIYGPLSDRYGRKPIFAIGIGLYVVAGFATTFAPSLTTLLIGRFLWGLGAAGPRVISQAMLRDRFEGDVLSRAMSVVLTVFLIVPTLAPAIGEALLRFGSWRYPFAIGPIFGCIVLAWMTRIDETLEATKRSPLNIQSIGRSTVEVLRTRSSLANMVALVMVTAAFLPYLASSERLYNEVYDRGSQFFIWFAATSIVMAGLTFASSRIVTRLGTKRTTAAGFVVLIAVAAVNLGVTYRFDGKPSFFFFFVATTIMVSINTALLPLITSAALDEVGHIAGTAASTIGGVSFIGASLLSPLVDGAITNTVTPFVAGFFVFTIAAAIATTMANNAPPATADDAATSSTN